MALRPARSWTVTPHGPICAIDDNVWEVESAVPGRRGAFPRRMSIIRLQDGALLFHNAVPLRDDVLADLQGLGQPRFLVVPSPFHCLDAHAFRAKLNVQVLCPSGAKQEISERVQVDGTLDSLPKDPCVRFVALDGVPAGEGFIEVTSREGARRNLVLNDVILNVPHLPGPWGLLYRMAGLTGGPRCGPRWLKRAVKDPPALKAQLELLSKQERLERLIPSHGSVISKDVGRVLSGVASRIR
ncbi:MAG: hypothetical protein ACT4TC_07035 [Myxococcaceae bacterium]